MKPTMDPPFGQSLTQPPRSAATFLLISAFLLVITAILTLRLDTSVGWLNLATLTTLSAICASIAYFEKASPTLWQRAKARAQQHHIRLDWLALALGCAILTAMRYSLRMGIDARFSGATTAMWIVSWLALFAGVWPAQGLRLRARLAEHRREIAAVALVTLIGGGFRFVALGQIPNILIGDEGMIGNWALGIGVNSGALSMPFGYMDGVGTIYLGMLKAMILVFGANEVSLRLLPALAGTLALPAIYLFSRSLFGTRVAWIALAILTVSHVHIHFSRTVAVSYIYSTVFVPMALYFLISGMERRSPFRLSLSILMISLHANTYIDAWVWLVLLFLLLGAWVLIDRSLFSRNAVNLGVFALALLVILTPNIIWSQLYPAEFGSRMAIDGTFTSGWLPLESSLTGRPEWLIVADLFRLAITSFYERPFLDFYDIGVPTLDIISRPFWMIGLVIALIRTWNPRYVTVNGWFWGGVFAMGVTTIPPSTYHYRLLVVLPVAYVLVAIAIDWGLTQLQTLLKAKSALARIAPTGVAAALLLGIAAINLPTYFVQFAQMCSYSDLASRQASLLGAYLADSHPQAEVWLLHSENGFRYGPHESIPFLSGRMKVTNVDAPLSAGPPPEFSTSAAGGVIVVAVPERAAELAIAQSWIPGGTSAQLSDCGVPVLSIYHWR